jgi:hypothetical protein
MKNNYPQADACNQQFTQQELEAEIWKEIKGYGGSYFVSSIGRVKSFKGRNKDGRILKGSDNGHGYLVVGLSLDGKGKTVNIHRLVCEAFCVREQTHFIVCDHIDGDRQNNRCENLRWTTARGNGHNTKTNNEHIGVSGGKGVNMYQVDMRPFDIGGSHGELNFEKGKNYCIGYFKKEDYDLAVRYKEWTEWYCVKNKVEPLCGKLQKAIYFYYNDDEGIPPFDFNVGTSKLPSGTFYARLNSKSLGTYNTQEEASKSYWFAFINHHRHNIPQLPPKAQKTLYLEAKEQEHECFLLKILFEQ